MKRLDEAYNNFDLVRAADLLYSEKFSIREDATKTLLEAGEESIPILKKILTGEEAERLSYVYDEMHSIPRVHLYGDWTKREAAEILTKIGDASLPVLLELLEHKDEKTRDAAVVGLRSEELADKAVDLVLPLLQHKKYPVRDAAAKVLALHDSPQIIDGFREMLRNEIAQIRKQRKRKRRYLGVMVCLYFSGFGLIWLAHGKGWSDYFRFIFHGFQFLGSFFVVKSVSNASKDAIKTAQGKFDARMLGTLVMCLEGADNDTREIVTQELKRILVEAKTSDRKYLNDEEMKSLLRQLDGKDVELTIAILKGLEQIGDERALPYVERLAQKTDPKCRKTVKEILLTPIGGAKPKPEDFVTVSDAAKACLPYLHQRIQEASASSTLLRASSQIVVTHSEELLRPAAANAERHEAELLRASRC